jgi:hypothetical protein
MGHRAAVVRKEPRLGDRIGLGLIARAFPAKVHAVLAASGRASLRQRALPAHVVVYYVIALALYMPASCREVLRCLLEGLHGLIGRGTSPTVAGKSGISQARTRLGFEVMQHLHDDVVGPVALPDTRGAWYRGWRLVSLDGSTLDVADEDANAAAFGRPASSRGDSAFPQIRFVSLVENGSHVLFASRMAGCATPGLDPGGDRPRQGDPAGLAPRYAVPGGPQLLRLRDVAAGSRHRRRSRLAHQEEPAPCLRQAPARRLLSQPHLSLRQGSQAWNQCHQRAGHR